MPADLLTLSRRYRAQLDAQDEVAMTRLVNAYRLMYSRLEGRVDALLLELEAGKITAGGLARLERFKSLMEQIEQEVSRFSSFLRTEIELSAERNISAGLTHSKAYLSALEISVDALPVNAIKRLLGFLSEGSPLWEKIDALAGVQAARVREALLEGIGLGYNPRKIASMIQDAFGGGLTDALRMTRTVNLWSYREAARANYTASGVVDGWIWSAELDGDTCAVCIAENGTIHELDEELDGHFNCRCSALPYIKGLNDELAQSGSDWFDAQTEAVQKNVLGEGKWQAWKDGKFTLSDLIDHAENDTYGRMVREKSLSEMVGE